MDLRRPELRDGVGGRRQRRWKWRCSFYFCLIGCFMVRLFCVGGTGRWRGCHCGYQAPNVGRGRSGGPYGLPFWRQPTRPAGFCHVLLLIVVSFVAAVLLGPLSYAMLVRSFGLLPRFEFSGEDTPACCRCADTCTRRDCSFGPRGRWPILARQSTSSSLRFLCCTSRLGFCQFSVTF